MKERHQLSPNVRIVSDTASGMAMVYHTLYGNPRIVNGEGLLFLNLFRLPVTAEEIRDHCDEDPREVIEDFTKIFFLIEPGFDEKKFLYEQRTQYLAKVRARQTIDRMGLALSDSCNFACKRCIHFQPSGDNGEVLPIYQKSARDLNMSWETAKKCIDHYVALIREQGHSHGKIHFGNAEPLINWSVIKQVLQYCESLADLTFEFAVNTNLSLMTREIAGVFKKYQVRIASSLDGTAQANDTVRVSKVGEGTFDRIVTKFDLLAEIGYPLAGFSVTVTSENFDLIGPDIIDFAAERGMAFIAFDYDLVGLTNIPVAMRVAKIMFLKSYANKKGIDFFGTWDSTFRNLTSESLLDGNHAFCAAIGGRSLEFNVDGSIKVCSHSTTQVGHVDNFDEVFEETGGLAKIVSDRFPGTDEYCFGCPIEGPCGGQCHVTREVVARAAKGEHRKLFADMCDFYRLVTDALAMERISSKGAAWTGNRQSCTI